LTLGKRIYKYNKDIAFLECTVYFDTDNQSKKSTQVYRKKISISGFINYNELQIKK